MVITGAAALLLPLTCGKKKSMMPAIIFGGDTLTAEQVATLDPVGANDSVRLWNVAVRLVCAGGMTGSVDDAQIRGCSERLLLVSGVEWNSAAAALLLRSARHLIARLGGEDPCDAARHFTDSLRQSATRAVSQPGAAARWPKFACDTIDLSQRPGRVWLTGSVLGLPGEVAELLIEFVDAPQQQETAADSAALKNLVSGLVSSGKSAAAAGQTPPVKTPAHQPPVREPQAERPDNSAEALRYRTLQSIRDSIDKHIPDLRQLYKKCLKANSSLAGKVIVTMRVGAEGRVISVRIKASEIGSKVFLDPFAEYLHTIAFKPIPEKVGAMTFDFPFEFDPEM